MPARPRHPAARPVPGLLLLLGLAAAPLAAVPDLDRDRLARDIPPRLRGFVEDGTIAGAVALVARGEGEPWVEAAGYADLAARKPLRTDSLFWIASMTKPFTATAVLLLRDEGKLSLDDPLERHLPEFRDPWMVSEGDADRLVLRRPPRKVAIRDLLTHTSGLANAPDTGRDLSLAELVLLYSQRPLRFPPGSRWEYSNAGMNTLGRLVEVVSGRPYAEFLEERIFRPLGMADTTFWPGGDQLERLAKSYRRRPGGGLEETSISFLRGGLSSRKRTALPSGGLFSTAADLLRFYRMALAGGIHEGKRIIAREDHGR